MPSLALREEAKPVPGETQSLFREAPGGGEAQDGELLLLKASQRRLAEMPPNAAASGALLPGVGGGWEGLGDVLGDAEGSLPWGRGRVLKSLSPAGVHTCWGVWERVLGMLEVCA